MATCMNTKYQEAARGIPCYPVEKQLHVKWESDSKRPASSIVMIIKHELGLGLRFDLGHDLDERQEGPEGYTPSLYRCSDDPLRLVRRVEVFLDDEGAHFDVTDGGKAQYSDGNED